VLRWFTQYRLFEISLLNLFVGYLCIYLYITNDKLLSIGIRPSRSVEGFTKILSFTMCPWSVLYYFLSWIPCSSCLGNWLVLPFSKRTWLLSSLLHPPAYLCGKPSECVWWAVIYTYTRIKCLVQYLFVTVIK